MDNVVERFFALPTWYFTAIGGPLWVIPTIGILGLATGVIWGVDARARGLLVFLVLPAASQILVAVNGFMRGCCRDDPSTFGNILLVFMLLQIAGAGYLMFRSKSARLPATALAIFTSSYAYFASFVVTMEFVNQ